MQAAAHQATVLATIVAVCLLLLWLTDHKAPWQ